MYFKNSYHEQLFNAFIHTLGTNDPYYRGFAHVAAAVEKEGVAAALSDHDIDREILIGISRGWSNSERTLMEAAWQMFNDGNLYEKDEVANFPSFDSVFRSLDAMNSRVVIEALSMKYLGGVIGGE